jgi:hypothetical protein
VLSSFACPRSSCTTRRFFVRRYINDAFVRRRVSCHTRRRQDRFPESNRARSGHTGAWTDAAMNGADSEIKRTRLPGILALPCRLMTLREYLARRDRKVFFPGVVVTLIVLAFAVNAPKQSAWTSPAFCAPFLFLVVMGIYSGRARCPKCKARLGHIEFERSRRGGPLPVGFDRCLSCGLHGNEKIPVPPTP